MLTLRRGIHTRPKKVRVQLLKTFPLVGLKGEVLDVKEGLMRHKLHPGNGAAYVCANEPLRIPLLTREEANKITKAAEAEAKAVLNRQAEQQQQQQPQETSASQRDSVKSLLDSLSFPTATKLEAKNSQSEVKREVKVEQPSQDAPKKQFEWQNEFIVNMTEKNK